MLNLRVPPLCQRKQDIPLLAAHFLERITRAGVPRVISDEAMKTMLNYDWPGNVRELENCLERACALSSGPLLQHNDFPSSLQNSMLQPVAAAASAEKSKIVPVAELERQAIQNAIEQLNGDKLMAARLLGMGKTTLYRKLKAYGFDT